MQQFDPIGDYLLHPDYGAWLADTLSFIQSPTAQEKLSANTDADGDDFWTELGSASGFLRPYKVADGVLQIPVFGALMHRFPYAFGSWATGYDYIREAVKRGLGDENVRGIALVVDSPGGMVSGCFDLADYINEAANEKPILAVASEHAYSAAYAIASAATSITVARTGGVGSIGVVATHVDMSKAVEDRGMKVTFIHAGQHKVDGNPYEPLPDNVRARIQERVDTTYSLFVSTVARNRSMDETAVRATEADVFMSQESVENGLADEVGPFMDALAAFAVSLSQPEREIEMSNENNAVDQAAHLKAVADAKSEGLTEGKATGLTEGASAERQRIKGIMDSDEAKKRPVAAQAAAMDTDMSVDAAKAFLAKLPEEGAAQSAAAPKEAPKAAAASAFENAMASTGNPDLGAQEDSVEEEDVVDRIFRNAGVADKAKA